MDERPNDGAEDRPARQRTAWTEIRQTVAVASTFALIGVFVQVVIVRIQIGLPLFVQSPDASSPAFESGAVGQLIFVLAGIAVLLVLADVVTTLRQFRRDQRSDLQLLLFQAEIDYKSTELDRWLGKIIANSVRQQLEAGTPYFLETPHDFGA